MQAYDAYPIAYASIEMGELEKAENYINIMQQLFPELKIEFSLCH